MKLWKLCAVALCLAIPLSALSQTTSPRDTAEHLDLKVYYHVNSSVIEDDYSNNGANIENFISVAQRLQKDKNISFKTITFIGSASPEGIEINNTELSKNRSGVIFSRLKPYITLPSESSWKVKYIGEDWEGFIEAVQNSNIKDKDKVVRIARETPTWVYENGEIVGGRKDYLRRLNVGDTWHEMEKVIFPSLRYATVRLDYMRHIEPAPEPKEEKTLVTRGYEPTPELEPVSEPQAKPFVFAVKTNLFHDFMAAPSIGLEFPFKDHWSATAEWTYSWWKKEDSNWFNRCYGGNAGVRYWLKPFSGNGYLKGHHFGAYGQMFTFDFINGKRASLDEGVIGREWKYAAGLEYGYSCKLAKALRLDLCLGVGHIWGDYDNYRQVILPLEEGGGYEYARTSTEQFPVICPTKAEASLVWIIDWNRKK